MRKHYKCPSLWSSNGLKKAGISVLALFGAIQGLNAQVSDYIFSQSNGTFSSIASTGTIVTGSEATTSTTNDTTGWTVTIPFNFNFNGTDYTSIYVNSNGGAVFGSTTSNAATVISSSTGYSGAVGVMNRDLWGVFITSGVTTSGSDIITNVGSFKGIEIGKTLNNVNGIPLNATITAFDETAGTITMSAPATSSSSAAVVRYGSGKVLTSVEGTAPNRVFVIEWIGYNDFNASVSGSNYLNFQLRLSETTNVISTVYGPYYNVNTTSRTNQIGLRGATNTDFNNRIGAVGNPWDSTSPGTSNSSNVSRDNTNFPASGLTFMWTPSTCKSPTAPTITSSSITANEAQVTWTASQSNPTNGYEVYYSTSNTAPTMSTVLDATNSVTSATNSATINGLTPSTMYYVWVRSACSSSDKSNWTSSASFTTLPTCFVPTALTVNSATITANSATASWTAPSTTPANGYEVYYSTSNTAPTSSTVLDATNSLTSTTTSVTIGNLLNSTTYYVWVRSVCIGTDRSVWTAMSSFRTLCQPPALLSTTGATVCPGNTATLSATADTGATINWYSSANGGTAIATGNSFTTPSINSTTSYWATASTGSTNSAGLTNAISTSGYTLEAGLFFNAITSFTLEGVYVYPTGTGAGTVTIALQDGSVSPATTIESITVNLTGNATPVKTYVPLNFTVPVGTNYKLMMMTRTGLVTGLIRESGTTWGSYPLTVPGVLSITNGNCCSGNTTSTSYYYFYDWKVVTGCESARQQVTATADSSVCLGTSETDLTKNNIKVYPNPFSDVLNISDIKNVKSISVMDIAGRLVKTFDKPASTLQLRELNAGMYMIVLHMNDGTKQTLKAIKK
ncbi:T9SS type A sorting domain-containing protein [Flavobacteriaceae bacterium W22]|nr:T9SS type A sorting domain-containing protein [Flavobacteriaceae bacterium W22]